MMLLGVVVGDHRDPAVRRRPVGRLPDLVGGDLAGGGVDLLELAAGGNGEAAQA